MLLGKLLLILHGLSLNITSSLVTFHLSQVKLVVFVPIFSCNFFHTFTVFFLILFRYIFLLLYIYLFLTALELRCCMWAFSSCGERGLLFVAVRRLLIVVGGCSCCGARALGGRASVVVTHGLSSCGSQALERRLSSCGAGA